VKSRRRGCIEILPYGQQLPTSLYFSNVVLVGVIDIFTQKAIFEAYEVLFDRVVFCIVGV